MGLFNPQRREEQAHYDYHENARFREDLRENKRKIASVLTLVMNTRYGLSDKT